MPNHLTDQDVKWALKHLEHFGDNDLFPRPFEIEVLTSNATDVVKYVRGLDLGHPLPRAAARTARSFGRLWARARNAKRRGCHSLGVSSD